MADRTPSDSPMASDRLESKFNAYKGGDHNWTEGLPHDFRGWGPQTPDPAEDLPAPTDMHVKDDGLHWSGGEEHRHIVWRFDRRHHH
ncbi:MAG: hypothetical protein EON61_06590 [Alphaproteobacteria bacterium]|nr:MAG: hypothetical protein EON61_06590 [Alphaproteobacteria bacterium]